MVPRSIQLSILAVILAPLILAKLLPNEQHWVATLVGLLAFGTLFPLILFIYIGNKKTEMLPKWSSLRNSPNKNRVKAIDILIRCFIGLLSLSIVLDNGIPILRDLSYLAGNEPVQFEATVLKRDATHIGTLVASQYLTIQKVGTDETDRINSMFIYERYSVGDTYIFSILPNSNKVLKIEHK